MKNKKILFIAPSFFNYYKEIQKELEKKGFEVDYVCDAPSNSNISKALGRINKRFIKISMNKYFNKEVMPLVERLDYDYVFVIVGMTFSFFPEMIEKIRTQNKNAKFIMYQWDGEKNISFVKKIHKYFDNIYSFDRIDCLNNDIYEFLPLFYTSQYEDVGNIVNNEFKYDVSYVGTAHPQKIKNINIMSKKFTEVLKEQYIYHYMPSKLKYFFHKLTSKEYRDVNLSDMKLEKLSAEQMMDIFKKSKCVFDSPQKGQNGLTIRTIECLGAKRKLITTNRDIINYDFFDEKNILIYDEKININDDFFVTEYKDIQKEIYEKYSLRNWLKEMIK